MSFLGDSKGECDEALRSLAGRIKSLLEEERDLLSNGNTEGLDRIIARKDQLAIELARYAKHSEVKSVHANANRVLDEIARALGSNAELLHHHIQAVSAVAAVICNVLAHANSDGTYTNCITGRGTRV